MVPVVSVLVHVIYGVSIFVVNHAPELAGIIYPPLIDILNKDVPNEDERYLVCCILCVVTAVIFKWNTLLFGNEYEVATTLGIIFFESQTVYRGYFKRSFLRRSLQNYLSKSPSESEIVTPTDSTSPTQPLE